jgi:hypothetical protein
LTETLIIIVVVAHSNTTELECFAYLLMLVDFGGKLSINGVAGENLKKMSEALLISVKEKEWG